MYLWIAASSTSNMQTTWWSAYLCFCIYLCHGTVVRTYSFHQWYLSSATTLFTKFLQLNVEYWMPYDMTLHQRTMKARWRPATAGRAITPETLSISRENEASETSERTRLFCSKVWGRSYPHGYTRIAINQGWKYVLRYWRSCGHTSKVRNLS